MNTGKKKRDSCPTILFSRAVPSACFVLDENRLLQNAAILEDLQNATGAKVLLALKGFANWAVFPLLSRAHQGPLWGTCASSVDEARLGREHFGGEVHAFSAAWDDEDIAELLQLADHIIFNSLNQWNKYKPAIADANAGFRKNNPVKCGLRINPEHSEGAVAIYNPCSPGSRLGIRKREFQKHPDLTGISGLHFHTLCEQNADALARTLDVVDKNFAPYLKNCQWINWGGGHHITREDYDLDLLRKCVLDWNEKFKAQIYLEPGEAVALDAGWLTATVLDIVQADLPVAILDVSAACHMPDVLEMPYTPDVWYECADKKSCLASKPFLEAWTCKLAGKSCLAGDVVGEYSFKKPLEPGQRLVFADMAIYSMVKTTTFNGLRLPSIGILDGAGFHLLRKFSYEDFKNRLS